MLAPGLRVGGAQGVRGEAAQHLELGDGGEGAGIFAGGRAHHDVGRGVEQHEGLVDAAALGGCPFTRAR